MNCENIYIVTPCFNSVKTIKDTFESVVYQKSDFYIHYHIQDGGSTDGTVELVKSLIEKSKYTKKVNVTISSEPDEGMYDAIVKGVSKFKNIDNESWLTWINSDDQLAFDCLESISKINSKKEILWVTGKPCLVSLNGNEKSSDIKLNQYVAAKGLCDGFLWNYIQQEGTFFKYKLWKFSRISDKISSFKLAGDWWLWKEFASKARLYHANKILAKFFIRPGQLSSSNFINYFFEIENELPVFKREISLRELNNKNDCSYKIIEFENNECIIKEDSVAGHVKYRKNILDEIEKRFIIKNGIVSYNDNWQYPAITEKHAFEKIKEILDTDSSNNIIYLAFPWATLIDSLQNKKQEGKKLLNILFLLKKHLKNKTKIVTVCQHILMIEYQDIFKKIGVTDIFWTHAIKSQKTLPKYNNINIYPFPLYPVQAIDLKIKNKNKSYLFSFIGAKSNDWYLTQSRTIIIDNLSAYKNAKIKGRDSWHYNKVVYDYQINKSNINKENLIDDSASLEFQDILNKSIFSLCPSGSGPNSIRLWESIGYGSIPVILADTYLPPGNTLLWDEAVVFCNENEEDIKALPARLEKIAQDPDLLARKRQALKQLWMLYGPDCFVYDILKFFLKHQAQPQHTKKYSYDIEFLEKHGANERMITLAVISRVLSDPVNFKIQLSSDFELENRLRKLLKEAKSDSLLNKVCMKKEILL